MNSVATLSHLAVNLAATLTADMVVSFPKYGSPKYDGHRIYIEEGAAYSRNNKLIPNKTVQAYFADGMCDGMDGELLSGKHDKNVFKRTSSVVRAVNGGSEWHFKVFDVVGCPTLNFSGRLQNIRDRMAILQDNQKHKVSMVIQTLLFDDIEMLAFEEACLEDGYEGAMLRNPNAMYKNGRATPTSQDLLKVKRFEDSEAVLLGWTPMVVVKTGEVRHDIMGSLQVRDIFTGVEFSVGSGFDANERSIHARTPPLGLYLTYQFFAQGGYDKPRFPTFKGFRTDIDMTAKFK